MAAVKNLGKRGLERKHGVFSPRIALKGKGRG